MTPETFTEATAAIPYQARGMFPSEVYLFTTICLAAGVTHIIESGVCNGMSTRLLHAVWPHRVVSVDHHAGKIPSGFPFPVLMGDAHEIVPAWIASRTGDVIGVLLDGPKGVKGDRLRAVCAALPQVRVIGQHDSGPGKGETVHSWDPLWRAAVGTALDVRIDPVILARYPHGAPGLGVWRIA